MSGIDQKRLKAEVAERLAPNFEALGADLKPELENLHNIHFDIPALLGKEPNINGYLVDRIYLELKQEFDADYYISIANMAFEWLNSGDSFYFILIKRILKEANIGKPHISTPHTIDFLDRFNSDSVFKDSNPNSKSKSIRNRISKSNCFMLMCNLIFHGQNLETAAAKAAGWHNRTYPELNPRKATSLHKNYEKEFRLTDLESNLHKKWRSFKSKDCPAWAIVIDTLIEDDPGPNAPSRH